MKKVDRGVYKHIKGFITEAIEERQIPSHKEQKRSRKRNVYYRELAHAFDLSLGTVHNIGRAKSYPNFRDIQNWKKTAEDQSQDRKMINVRVDYTKLRNDLTDALNEISALQSEMAIIKAKKARWFK